MWRRPLEREPSPTASPPGLHCDKGQAHHLSPRPPTICTWLPVVNRPGREAGREQVQGCPSGSLQKCREKGAPKAWRGGAFQG